MRYELEVRINGNWERQQGLYSAAGFGTDKAAFEAIMRDISTLKRRGYEARYVITK